MSAGPAVVAELRDGTPVGAWLFKARPDVWDIATALRDHSGLDTWRMAPSYRTGLVAAGQPCALWVTGAATATAAPGVWAVGHITSEPYEDAGDPDDELWHDETARRQIRPYVSVELDVLAHPIPRADLRADPRFERAEILVAPRVASPVALRPDEWTAIIDRVA